MKTKIFTLALFIIAVHCSYGQANQNLSNLLAPTAINQDLLPASDNSFNLGKSLNSWKNLYFKGAIYKGSNKFIFSPNISSTFMGTKAGNNITTGYANTGVGDSALFSDNSGYANTAVGYYALFSNTDALYNTATGYWALKNTNADWNTAHGAFALIADVNGSYNSAFGAQALNSNNNGNFNTAMGYQSMYPNINGSYNTACGYQSLISNKTGSDNTAIGDSADVLNSNLTNATAIGARAKVAQSNSLVLGGTGNYGVNVGIGTTSPLFKLDINSGSSSTAVRVIGTNAAVEINSAALLTRNNGKDLYIRGDEEPFGSTFSPGNVIIQDNSINGLNQTLRAGNVGIGLTNPSHAKLEVYGSVGASVGMFRSSGADSLGVSIHGYFPEVGLNYYYNGGTKTIGKGYAAVMSLDPSNGDWYVANFSGLKSTKAFGDIDANALQKPLIITQVGNVGIGLEPINTSGFNDAKLQVESDGDDNLRLVAHDSTNDWSMYTADGTTGNLFLYKNGNFRGSFDATTGAYTSVGFFADDKSKTNITALSDVMEKLMQLQPKEYHFIENANAKNYSYGFIANDINKIFPECITSVKDRKTGEDVTAVNYNNMSVIAIKAIQELSAQNDSLKQSNQALNDKLNGLSNKINQIENAMSQCCNSFSSNLHSVINSATQSYAVNTARLDQNIPNPFNSNTSISYYVPSNFHSALLIITNITGKTLKTYSITQSGSGKQVISGSEFAGGMYQYSLIIDSKIVDTKKMVASK